jgi:hypothetical protein
LTEKREKVLTAIRIRFKERGMPENLFKEHAKRSEVTPVSGQN